jgi:plasmid stability protein
MSDLLIRGLDPGAVQRLKARAKRHARSLQSEARHILENASGQSVAEVLAKARQCRKKLGRRFEDSVQLIREDRER